MDQTKYLLPPVNKFFKAGLHVHTNITDGTLSPEETKEVYKSKGYSVLAVTDHNVVCNLSELNDPDFLMLTGAEYNINRADFGEHRFLAKTFHLNFLAKKPDILWQPFIPRHAMEAAKPYLAQVEDGGIPWECDLDTINKMIAEGNRRGYLVTLNHPHSSLLDYEDYTGLKGLWALELVNYGSMRNGCPDNNNSHIYSEIVNLGNRIFPVAADDSHGAVSACGAWVMVGAEALTYDSVIDALVKGDFYASTGPQIHALYITDGMLHIECSDAQFITVESGARFSKRVTPKEPDKLLRHATINMQKWFDSCTGMSPKEWFRVTVQGPYGEFAATRAFHFDEF